MKRAMILIAAVLALVAAEKPSQDPGKQDLERMQGDWQMASMIRDGEKVPDEHVEVLFRTVKGTDYTVFHFRTPLSKGTMRLDTTKTPRAIDFQVSGPMATGKPLLGIYEFADDNTLRFCYGAPGKERPTRFASEAESGNTLAVWTREKK
jgi:uncharacterized protein (TIGR03067 family)